MTKILPKATTLVSVSTRAFVAVILLALIPSSLICVSAQRKEKSAQTKLIAVVRPDAADQKARRRADALLAQMTLDEKLGQLNQLFFFAFQKEEAMNEGIRKGEIG